MQMPRVNFADIDDCQDYSPVPDGDYLCSLEEIEEKFSQNGNEMWVLKWLIIDGKYEGRKIFDQIVFTSACLPRIKLLCKRIGLDVSGILDLTSEMMKHKYAVVTTFIEEYVSSEGQTKRRNRVPYAGYEEAPLTQKEEIEF